jgi:hypothetical protein
MTGMLAEWAPEQWGPGDSTIAVLEKVLGEWACPEEPAPRPASPPGTGGETVSLAGLRAALGAGFDEATVEACQSLSVEECMAAIRQRGEYMRQWEEATDQLDAITSALGLPGTATGEEVVAGVREAVNVADGFERSANGLQEQLTALRAQLATARADVLAEVKRVVTAYRDSFLKGTDFWTAACTVLHDLSALPAWPAGEVEP